MSIPLPKPGALRRQQRSNGGYDMVPAYTVEELHAYAAACRKDERESIAAWLDAEHEKRKHLDNLAAYYAQAIRNTP